MSDQENATPTANAETTESAPVNEVPVETSEETTEPAQEGSQPTESEKKVSLSELTAERRKKQEARQEAAYLRGQLDAIQNTVTPAPLPQVPVVPALVEPNSDDFETWEAYEKANKRYLVDLAKYEIRQEQAQQQVKQQQTQVQQGFWKKVETLEAEDPDIRDTVVKVGNMVNTVVANLVVGSDVGIDLVKYFNQNPKEAKRISQLSPVMAAKEIGKLESHLENKPKPTPPKKVSLAPEPIKTVTPSGSHTQDEDNLPMDQWIKRRNEAQFKRR